MWESTMTRPIRMTKITAGWGTLLPTRSTPSSSLCMNVFGASTAGFDLIIERHPFPHPPFDASSRPSHRPEDGDEEGGDHEEPQNQRQPQLPVVSEAIPARSHDDQVHRRGDGREERGSLGDGDAHEHRTR